MTFPLIVHKGVVNLTETNVGDDVVGFQLVGLYDEGVRFVGLVEVGFNEGVRVVGFADVGKLVFEEVGLFVVGLFDVGRDVGLFVGLFVLVGLFVGTNVAGVRSCKSLI